MAGFYPVDGSWEFITFRKKASTAFVVGDLVAFETNGGAGDPIEPADASDTELLGICMEAAASGDATNDRIAILIPTKKGAKMFGDVGTGTLTVADEGITMDLKDENEVDQAANTTDVVTCTKFLTATTGWFTINKLAFK